jgi:hypothetical protein
MKTTAFTVSVLAISGVLFSAPASAACLDEIAQLDDAITSPLINASNEARQAAMVEKDAAVVLCENGDEIGAAERIANARVLLGL